MLHRNLNDVLWTKDGCGPGRAGTRPELTRHEKHDPEHAQSCGLWIRPGLHVLEKAQQGTTRLNLTRQSMLNLVELG